MVSVGIEGRSKGWRDFDCSRALALEPPSREPSLGAGRAKLGRWVQLLEAECYGLLGSPWQQGHHRGPAIVSSQALPQLGRKKGRGPGVGQPGLDAPFRLHVGYLAAHTLLLRQTQNKQGRSQERKGRLSTARQGRREVRPAWGLETRQTTPLCWGQAALIPEGLDRPNIQRAEHISSGSCRKTQGPGEAGTRLGPASPIPVLPMTTEYHGIGQIQLYQRHKERGFTTALGRTLTSELPCPHGLCLAEASQSGGR